MSNYVKTKGTLTPVTEEYVRGFADSLIPVVDEGYANAYEQFCDDLYYYCETYDFSIVHISGSWYQARVEDDTDPGSPEYCSISKDYDGTIHFDAYHFMRGWEEMVVGELEANDGQ